MVTLDNKIRNVGEFKGDLEAGRRNYERATQGLQLIVGEKSQLEEALKGYTEFDNLNLPSEPAATDIRRGDVRFLIGSSTRIKRPAYKEAVTGMENYIDGIVFLLSQKMDISEVFKRGRLAFMSVEKLFEAFSIIVGGVLKAEVVHTISYEVAGELASEKLLDELALREGRNPAALTGENFSNYVRLDRLEPILAAYVTKYEAALSKGQRKPKRVTDVTTRSAYETTKSKAEGPDWAYVVKTLVKVPTDPESIGELNILRDPEISKAEKERKLPHYQLTYVNGGDKILYVSIQSVSQRLQTLKQGPGIEARRLDVKPVEIV